MIAVIYRGDMEGNVDRRAWGKIERDIVLQHVLSPYVV